MILRLLSAGAAHPIVQAVSRAAGIEVEGTFGAVGAILDRFDAGDPCDVVILTRKQIDQLGAGGRIVPGTAADLGRVATSIAVRAGQPQPDVSTSETLRDALVAAEGIFFPDPAKATAGIHFVEVLKKLGIHDKVRPGLHAFPNGATAMREMAQSKRRSIGCTQATEILATPGVKLVAALPEGYDLVTTYTAAVNAKAANVKGASAFVARLAGESSASERSAAGFL
ncbi:MAG TPA: substrate-binding domain-containing protein [Usitatibacter sp.]|nr:substrate-binding domain-containing protein [Usitatibacter sp.]